MLNTTDNYFFGLVGAVLLILIWLKTEKDKRDVQGNKVPYSWKEYFNTHWDDYLAAVVFAFILVTVQEYVFGAYAKWQEWDKEYTWDLYYDTEEVISFACGLFSTTIVKLIYKKKDKLEKL